MKKIVLLIMLVCCLTGCEKDEMKDSKNQVVEEDVKIEEAEIKEEKIASTESEIETNVSSETLDEPEEKDVEVSDNELQHSKEEIEYEAGIEVGNKAIDFEIELLSGERVKLSSYLGKPVFLNFWATWCGPCVGEMPDIEKMKSEYGEELVILAINGGELKDDVKAFIDRKGYTFNVGIDENGKILTTYDSMYIPLSIFIDENGIIKERQVGALSETQMKEIINKLLSKS